MLDNPLQIMLWLRLLLVALCVVFMGWLSPPANALLNDDRYDGNIFALYGSNGGMIPPRVSLKQAKEQGIPALLVYYIDDSSDCKKYAATLANLQVRYGLGVYFIPYSVDSLLPGDERGQYYSGQVPQTLLFDSQGNIAYQSIGNRPITEVENAIRALFHLDPVPPGVIKAKPFNEIQTGFSRPRSPAPPAEAQP
ncbi:thylakoid membrane photosystem I accumulation factor [Synechococcus sp. H55.7]|uniref:thylakoid membrane photosystem I accumulation factor n=1 Tax=unclassified Synechococcus TaxID=2626047 RepID=UPI0039C23BB9